VDVDLLNVLPEEMGSSLKFLYEAANLRIVFPPFFLSPSSPFVGCYSVSEEESPEKVVRRRGRRKWQGSRHLHVSSSLLSPSLPCVHYSVSKRSPRKRWSRDWGARRKWQEQWSRRGPAQRPFQEKWNAFSSPCMTPPI